MRQDDQPAPPKLFPQWRTVEQDWWMDCFQDFSQLLLEQRKEEQGYEDITQDARVSRIREAALLADEATKEMIYRFTRQQPVKRTAHRRGDDGRSRSRRLV